MNGESSLQGGTDSPASSDSPAATPTPPSAVARPPEGGAGAAAAAAAAGTDEHPEGRHTCVGQWGDGCGKVELIQGSQGSYRCFQVLTN